MIGLTLLLAASIAGDADCGCSHCRPVLSPITRVRLEKKMDNVPYWDVEKVSYDVPEFECKETEVECPPKRVITEVEVHTGYHVRFSVPVKKCQTVKHCDWVPVQPPCPDCIDGSCGHCPAPVKQLVCQEHCQYYLDHQMIQHWVPYSYWMKAVISVPGGKTKKPVCRGTPVTHTRELKVMKVKCIEKVVPVTHIEWVKRCECDLPDCPCVAARKERAAAALAAQLEDQLEGYVQE